MVDNNVKDKEDEEARVLVLEALGKNPRGMTITALVKYADMNRTRTRTAIAYLLGAGKIEEVRVSMAKLYYLI